MSSSSGVRFGGPSTAHWGGASHGRSGGSGGGGGNKFVDHGCFDDQTGEVYCFCNTQPRIKAKRLVTRKESSPNLGREFWSCGNWVEGEGCGLFLWVDQAASKGRRYETPPPPGSTVSRAPPSSPQKRPRPSTPPKPASSFRAASTTPCATPAVTESFDDIDFDALAAGAEDEIEDEDDEEPATQYSSAGASQPSPSKKQRFTSFGGGSEVGEATAEPSTPTKGSSQSQRSGFSAIRDDPDSPFHSIQRNLFGSSAPSSAPAPPSSAPSSPTKPLTASEDDTFSTLSSALAGLPSLLDAAKKDRDRDQRLLQAGKKKEEALRRQVEKAKEEAERVKRENEGLKERVRMLEEEVNELRSRAK
ncbi:hypothetical protein JCM10213_007218 [Rhodosporidiobolus nylandii]